MVRIRLSPVLGLVALAVAGCSDTPLQPSVDAAPQFAKGGGAGGGGGTTVQRVNFDLGASDALNDDGGGVYLDQVCGTVGSWADILFLSPAEGSIPKSQKAACANAMRSATITLAVSHGSADPADHSADAPADGGTWEIGNVKFGSAGGAVVNMYGPCNSQDSRGRWGGTGLRFNAASYPGSSNVISDDLGGGAWRFHTGAYPDNMAYCQLQDGTGTFWHVDLDVAVQIVG